MYTVLKRWVIAVRLHYVSWILETKGYNRNFLNWIFITALPLDFEKFWQKMMYCHGKLSTSSSKFWKTSWAALTEAVNKRAWQSPGAQAALPALRSQGQAPGLRTKTKYPLFQATWTGTPGTGSQHSHTEYGTCHVMTRPVKLLTTRGSLWPSQRQNS